MFLLALLFTTVTLSSFQCDVRNLIIDRTSTHQGIVIKTKSDSTQNLRIKVVYDRLFNELENGEDLKKYCIEPAVKFIENSIKPKSSLLKPLLLERYCTGTLNPVKVKKKDIYACYKGCTNKFYDFVVPKRYLAKCNYFDTFGRLHSSEEDGAGAENTDLLLFIRHIKCEDSTLASSKYIRLDRETDRPVAGFLQICDHPSMQRKLDNDQIKEDTRNIIIHELVHILGFSFQLYPYFRDQNGSPRTQRNYDGDPNNGMLNLDNSWVYKPSNNTFVEVKRKRYTSTGIISKTVGMLTTPAVTNEAKKHFNCQSLSGIFLEDNGDKINAYSHLESTYFQGEVMLSKISQKMYVSRFTLAVLQDTGWYNVNYDKADKFLFGKGLGCDFLTKSCFKYMADKKRRNESIYPYCDIPNDFRCSTADGINEICSLTRNSNNVVPDKFKYFPDKSLVSNDVNNDYCPTYLKYMTCPFFSKCNKCSQDPNYHTSLLGSEIDDKCFQTLNHTKWRILTADESLSLPMYAPECYKYECSVQNRLKFTIGPMDYTCHVDYELKYVEMKLDDHISIYGQFVCPKCNELCQEYECRPISLALSDSQQLRSDVLMITGTIILTCTLVIESMFLER